MRRNGLVNPILVIVKRFRAHLQLEVGELRKHHIVQVVTFQCESFRFVECLINKLAFPLIDDVVVAYKLLSALLFNHFVMLIRYSTRQSCVTDTNKAFLNKVHLVHFLVLVVYYVVINIILKTSRQEALSNRKE